MGASTVDASEAGVGSGGAAASGVWPATDRLGRTVPQLAQPTAHDSFSAEQRAQVHRSFIGGA